MKRDMDLVRAILLEIEAGNSTFVVAPDDGREDNDKPLTESAFNDFQKLAYHLNLLESSGFITFGFKGAGCRWVVGGMSWTAHDFLDAVRDNAIWDETKEGALKAGGWTFDLLKDIAIGYVRKRISEHTGIEL